MIVSHESRDNAVLTDSKRTYVLRYDADYLCKYSTLLIYPSWTMEKVLKELREDLALKISLAFPNEEQVFVEGVLDSIMPYASANIHDPRKERAKCL